MTKKLGAILFLVCSIVNIVLAVIFRTGGAPKTTMAILSVVAVVGAFLTGSKGVWVYVVGWLLTMVGAMGWIPNTTVNTVLTFGGEIITIVAIILIWKDSIKDIFAK